MTYGLLAVILSFSWFIVLFLLVRLNYLLDKQIMQINMIYNLQLIWARNWGKDPNVLKSVLDNILNSKQ